MMPNFLSSQTLTRREVFFQLLNLFALCLVLAVERDFGPDFAQLTANRGQ
jgi:hypothetical protein